MRKAATVLAAAIVVVLGACGTSTSSEASERLMQRTNGIRTALEKDDYALAASRLGSMEGEAAALAASGDISEYQSAEILAAIARLDQLLQSLEPDPVVSPVPEPTYTFQDKDDRDDGDDDKEDKGKGHADDKGKRDAKHDD